MKKLISLLSDASGLTSLTACVNADGSLNVEELEKQTPAIRKGIEGKLETAKNEATEEVNKANKGKTFDDGRTNGLAEGTRKVEKRLRELFGIEDQSVSGEDLFKAVSERKDKRPGEITRDQVESLDWFRKLLDQSEQEKKKAAKDVQDKFDEFKETTSKKERMQMMRSKATPIIEELNLNFSPDPQRKASQLDKIFRDLEESDYEFKDDVALVKGKDGKVLRDKLENSIAFRDHVAGVATSWLDPKESKDRSSAGNRSESDNGGNKSKWSREMPKNQMDFERTMLDTSIPLEEREALMKAWPEHKAA